MITLHRSTALLLSVLAGAALVSGCERSAQDRASNAAERAVMPADRNAESSVEATRAASQAIGNAADALAYKSRDIAITTEVHARLARDERLSAQMSAPKITVDTEGGRVVLRGAVPDTATRNRATEIVRSVDGVSNVSNELSVQASR